MTHDEVEALYRRYGAIILDRCRRILRDPSAAEDAAQEVFIRVLRSLPRDSSPRVALAYLYRIAGNYCLNVLRDRRPREALEAATIELPLHNPEAVLANRDLAERLVRRAPAKVREVAWLHHVDGLSQEEVAEVMGMSRRTVINRLAEFERRSRQFLARTDA